MSRVRIMTYNVHSCRGSDGRLDPARVAAVVEASEPDIVALQELDVGQERSNGIDQAEFIGKRLGLEVHFVSARPCGGGHYGNAILTRFPSEHRRFGCLPQFGAAEPRAVQWVAIDTPLGRLDVFNTHLGLSRKERWLQVDSLLGREWLAHPHRSGHTLLCGDLNTVPGSPVYERLLERLGDAHRLVRTARPRATFPAMLPLLRIDYVMLSDALGAERVEVPGSLLARLASDHRPVIVDVGPGSEATNE
ncbi:MAG: endonuclease/exonuclease/phosphatase family protein [Pseudomonadota bacterium]|nr:MAG: endonuclease [Pseudomonadota bacterium]